jgi:ribonuclease P protein component
VLPADHRLTRPTAYRHAVKTGRRAGARTLVTHLAAQPSTQPSTHGPVQVGFVVGRSVGNAVVRNRVKRRLRHAARARIALLPAGALLVVRAQPPAASASYEELAADLDRCLDRSLADVAGSGQVER